MKKLRKSVALLLGAFLGVATALAQTSGAAPADAGSNRATYVDIPLPELRKAIPALDSLLPDASQDNLLSVLSSVANAIQDAVPRLPNLVSKEIVLRSQRTPGPTEPRQLALLGSYAGGPLSTTTLTPQDSRGLEFRYLILCNHSPNGIAVEESRTDPQGKPVNLLQGAKTPLGSGFAYQWLLFSYANQGEFRFRYLGEQEIEGRKAYVVAFAQIPERVKIPAVFRWHDKQASYYYQGILWADEETSQIVHLRTDLLAPLRSMQLYALTTDLRFRSIRIHDFDEDFWLPSEVHMSIAQEKYEIEEVHQYSDYHLYHSTATIVPIR